MKITLVALHYGEEGSGGARRSFLWAKGLRKAGHQVFVISPYVTGEHPDDIRVPYRNRASAANANSVTKPTFIEKNVKGFLRIWLRWPDPEISWHKQIIDIVKDKVGQSDWLITSSPPESAHRIGGSLAQALNAKWCAELRDSWVENSHRAYVRGFRRKIERRLAKYWLRNADVITSVNSEILKEAKRLAPQARAIEIGHFSEAFRETPHNFPEKTFNIIHAGGFERSDRRRSLSALILALTPIFAQRTNLHLHLIGPLTPSEKQILKYTKLAITYHGWVSLSESRALQAGADAALLYTPTLGSTALPGKYAEYCNLRLPIIFLGADKIKNMAHRRSEFLSLEMLVNFPKGQKTPIEREITTEQSVRKLLQFLTAIES